jgi:hypothetical protein
LEEILFIFLSNIYIFSFMLQIKFVRPKLRQQKAFPRGVSTKMTDWEQITAVIINCTYVRFSDIHQSTSEAISGQYVVHSCQHRITHRIIDLLVLTVANIEP